MAASALTHKELAAHVRGRVAQAGIKARVKMRPGVISVVVPAYDARFSADEIETICVIAQASHLTFVQGMPVIPPQQAQLTGRQQWDFYLS